MSNKTNIVVVALAASAVAGCNPTVTIEEAPPATPAEEMLETAWSDLTADEQSDVCIKYILDPDEVLDKWTPTDTSTSTFKTARFLDDKC